MYFAVSWWMRSAYSESQFRYVNSNGNANSNNASNTSNWLRPDLTETFLSRLKEDIP
ncbi:MAG: DUF6273 domain-containing protein [Dorea sp.]